MKPTSTPDDQPHDKIQEAAEQIKKAIIEMGRTDVAMCYAYSSNDACHTGGSYGSMIQAVGALTFMQHDLLTDKET